MRIKPVLIFLVLFFIMLGMAAVSQAQIMTTVADTLVGPNGTPIIGSLVVTNAVTMTTNDGFVIPAGQSVKVTLSSRGAFTVNLAPNTGSSPYNAFYYADYTTAAARIREEWVVPYNAAGPVKLTDVRALWPTAPNIKIPAAQFIPPPTCTPVAAALTNLVLRYTTNPIGWICAPDNMGAVDLNLENPTPADAGKFQWEPKNALTITRIFCATDPGNSVTINLDVRTESSSNNPAASQILTVPLQCTENGVSTTSFASDSVPAQSPVALLPLAISGTPGIVRVHVEYILN